MRLTPSEWILNVAPLPLVGLGILLLLLLAGELGFLARRHFAARFQLDSKDESNKESYIVSAVLGLLALLIGFTFAMAVDRFDTRRSLVVEEANAIGTTYLRADTFQEPYRSRLQRLLVRYVDNRLAVAAQIDLDEAARLLAESETLHRALWSISVAAVRTVRDDISSSFLESMTSVIELGRARVASRRAHIPPRVYEVLLIYMMVTAAVLGFVFFGPGRRVTMSTLLILLTLSTTLIIDLDRPTRGTIREPQWPMEDLKADLTAQSHGPD